MQKSKFEINSFFLTMILPMRGAESISHHLCEENILVDESLREIPGLADLHHVVIHPVHHQQGVVS